MFEILDEVCTPTKGTEFSACVDLYAREDVVIGAGETVLVPLGIKIDSKELEELIIQQSLSGKIIKTPQNIVDKFMKSHQLNLHIRSSMSAKHGLVIANGTGIIDLDYDGEIMICIHKPFFFTDMIGCAVDAAIDLFTGRNKAESYTSRKIIKKGDKIAQVSLVEHKTYLLGVESEEKRNGGFGSTDA